MDAPHLYVLDLHTVPADGTGTARRRTTPLTGRNSSSGSVVPLLRSERGAVGSVVPSP
ncbi:hypothetical protein [Streptomyces sp. NPDC048242]|uniref:hypothetical protein n=1 Tax=Streptomyces sp. NPDC048242 TaxID=3155026 RepID=UPI00343986FB